MSTWALLAIALGSAAALVLLGGCAVDTGVSRSTGSGQGTAYPPSSSPQPMLVDVDTDRILTAQPGEGVGVFTEYATGGHWHVWWTCDTNLTQQGCSYEVNISSNSGAVANVVGQMLSPGDQVVQSGAGQIDAVTQTFAGIDGVRFDAPPGDPITVEARLSGIDSGSLFFFVQDNIVNGDYKGALTDPLMFEPSAP